MRALTLIADRKLELADLPDPPAPAAGELQIRVRAVGLNHLDLWGYRGMAFAKRQKFPLVVGAEAAGEVVAIGPGANDLAVGDECERSHARIVGWLPGLRIQRWMPIAAESPPSMGRTAPVR